MATNVYFYPNYGGKSEVLYSASDESSYTFPSTSSMNSNFTRTGFSFSHWNTVADGSGRSFYAGQTYDISDTGFDFYAIWTPVYYQIKYSGNTYSASDVNNVPSNSMVLQGSWTYVSDLIPTRPGYDFLYWKTSYSQSSGTIYYPGDVITPSSDLTLYAFWQIRSYTITYNANGGSNPPSSMTQDWGYSVVVSAGSSMTRTGYTLKHWNTSPTDLGTTYQPGRNYQFYEDQMLYAIWEREKYTISYNANGGSGAPGSQTKEYGSYLYLTPERPVRNGYKFTGWATSSTGQAVYQPGGIYTLDQSNTLYAIWEPEQYVITYDANGGVGAPYAQVKTYNQTLTLSTTEPTETGYTFRGWSLTRGGAVAYQPGGSFTLNANTTLYAVWTIKTYTISYNKGNTTDTVSGLPSSQTKYHGQNISLSLTIPTRSGYSFLGWATSLSGVAVYSPGDTFAVNADYTLYAVWAVTITITYDANGGTNAPASQSGAIGNSLTLTPNQPSRATSSYSYQLTFNKSTDDSEATLTRYSRSGSITTTYTFKGWNTAADGSGTAYSGNQLIVLFSNMTLYAQWEPTVDGDVTLPTGSWSMHSLKGFSLTEGSKELVDDPYRPESGSTTLYAVWGSDGLGGEFTFWVDGDVPTPEDLEVGHKIWVMGSQGNDGQYTIAEVVRNGTGDTVTGKTSFTLRFQEDFPYEYTEYELTDELKIYGEGTYVPDMDYICSKDNRLWGCSSKLRTIYASALGDPTDFWTFAGNALDAYQVAVGSAGDFTGCCALNSVVLFFKQHVIHKMLGSYPAEYTMYTNEFDGVSVTNFASLLPCSGVAFYVSEHGIGTYEGATAGKLSLALGEGNMYNAIAGYDGEQYALYYEDANGNGHTYVYDIRYRIWLERDYGKVLAFAHLVDEDYVLIADEDGNRIIQTNTGINLTGDWEMLFREFYETESGKYNSTTHIFEKKRYTGLTFRLILPKGSWIKAEVRADGKRWYPVTRLSGRHEDVDTFVIKTPRCDKLQLRLTGHGNMSIIAMDRQYTIGSRR